MRASASSGGKSVRTEDVLKRPPAGTLPVPYRDVAEAEGLTLGFRQEMIGVGDPKKPDHGGVTCGAGCGTDFIILEWKGKTALVRGGELFRAWVATFDPESAGKMGF
jgi:hypothetical protein